MSSTSSSCSSVNARPGNFAVACDSRFVLLAADDPAVELLGAAAGHPRRVLRLVVESDVVRGDAVPPPQLPRDAPVANVLEPSEPRGLHERRKNLELLTPRRLARVRGHLLTVHPPLRLQHRLDHVLGTRAQAESHRVVRLAAVQPLLVQRLDDRAARGEPLHPFKRVPALVVHEPVLGEHVDKLEIVPFPRREIVRVVRRRDLNRARAEGHVHELRVRDDRYAPPVERMDQVLTVDAFIAIVIGVDRDRGVSEHRLRTRRRDDDFARAVLVRVREAPDAAKLYGRVLPRDDELFRALQVDVIDFDVRDGCLELAAPVHEAGCLCTRDPPRACARTLPSQPWRACRPS